MGGNPVRQAVKGTLVAVVIHQVGDILLQLFLRGILIRGNQIAVFRKLLEPGGMDVNHVVSAGSGSKL